MAKPKMAGARVLYAVTIAGIALKPNDLVGAPMALLKPHAAHLDFDESAMRYAVELGIQPILIEGADAEAGSPAAGGGETPAPQDAPPGEPPPQDPPAD